jgi:hypothetical protein
MTLAVRSATETLIRNARPFLPPTEIFASFTYLQYLTSFFTSKTSGVGLGATFSTENIERYG